MPGGFSFQQVIDIANKRTERIGITMDLTSEAIVALIETLTWNNWWWRRKVMTMLLKSGEYRFDLSDVNNFVGPDAALDFQMMTVDGFRVYTSVPGAARPLVSSPVPIFDFEQQADALALIDQSGAAPPATYFIQGNNPGTLFTTTRMPGDITASICYYAVPNLSPDDPPAAIPFLPVYAQGLFIKRLEMHIYAFGLGEHSDKYKAAAAEFEYLANKALVFRSFADGEIRSAVSTLTGDAVQST